MKSATHNSIFFWATCFAVFHVALLSPAIAEDYPAIPKQLTAKLHAVREGNYSIELKGTTLLYRTPQNKKDIRITPTPQQWRAFRQAIDEIDIWQWRSRYDGHITDNGDWSLSIGYADKSVGTGGDGGYPEETAAAGSCLRVTTTPFTRFRAAVQKLAGGRPFGEPVGPLELFPLAELRLVATHSSPKLREQWAEFRDPAGKVHRVWRQLSGCCAGRSPRRIYIGAEHAVMRDVTSTSVSLLELCHDKSGNLFERTRVLKKSISR
jgi:hypothetical protein